MAVEIEFRKLPPLVDGCIGLDQVQAKCGVGWTEYLLARGPTLGHEANAPAMHELHATPVATVVIIGYVLNPLGHAFEGAGNNRKLNLTAKTTIQVKARKAVVRVPISSGCDTGSRLATSTDFTEHSSG